MTSIYFFSARPDSTPLTELILTGTCFTVISAPGTGSLFSEDFVVAVMNASNAYLGNIIS